MVSICKATVKASLVALLCLLPVQASRTRTVQVEQHVETQELKVSKPRCTPTEATVKFNGFQVAFNIAEGRQLGKLISLKCGPATGTPEEEVGFECVRNETTGAVHYKKYFGWCKSKEQVAKENTPKCLGHEFYANWTIDGKKVDLRFAVAETPQPDKVDIPVTVPCPPNSPDPHQSATFTCRANATWDIKMEATKPCLALGEEVEENQNQGGASGKVNTDVEKGTLPCKLKVKHVPVEGDKDGFELLVTCTEAIEDAKIKKFQDGLDLTVSGVAPNTLTRITTQEIEGFLGKDLVLVAKVAGEDKYRSTSVVVKAEEPLTPGSLPCKLSQEAVGLQGGEEGFQVILECKEAITAASLKIPGYAPLEFGAVGKGRFTLTTQKTATFKGKVFVLVGSFENSEKSTNEVVI